MVFRRVAFFVAAYFISYASVAGAHGESFDSSQAMWLKPGWVGVIEAGKDAGQTITLTMEQDGLTVCGSTANTADSVIPSANHCNVRVTPVGYFVPAPVLFKGQSRIIEVGKIVMVSLPLAVAQLNYGAAAANGAILNSLVTFSPMSIIQAEHQMHDSFDTLSEHAQYAWEKSSAVLPRALMPFHFQDLVGAITDRVGKFIGDCNKIVRQGKTKDPNYDYCHRQGVNATKTGTIMSVCAIPVVPAQAGEVGGSVLWRLGQPLPAGCPDTLEKAGKHDILVWERSMEVSEYVAENPSTAQSLKDFETQNPDKTDYDWLLTAITQPAAPATIP